MIRLIIVFILVAFLSLLLTSSLSGKGNSPSFNKSTGEEILKKPNRLDNLPYTKCRLMSNSEVAMYTALLPFTQPRGYVIFTKIRLEDLANVNVQNFREKQRYRGYIKSRHVDFVVCDKQLNVIMAIEVDDKSHNDPKVKETDEFKNKFFEKLGIPLYRIKVGSSYRYQLEQIFNPVIQETPKNEV